jgi:hypothetical protein
VSGAVLRATPSGTDTTYRSEATDEAGRFALKGLPAGSYGLAVETDEGLYDSGGEVTLSAGRAELVLLGLAPGAQEGGKKKKGKDPGPQPVDESNLNRKTGMTALKNPLTITLITIGGLTLLAWGIDELRDSDTPAQEPPASRYLP